MYTKRILILESASNMCGIVKLANVSNATNVNLYVSNRTCNGEWYLLVNCGGNVFCNAVDTFNNFTFNLPLQSLDNVAVIVACNNKGVVNEQAHSYVGDEQTYLQLQRNLDKLTGEVTQYEKFVAGTDNYYEGVDVDSLRTKSMEKYHSVEEYSNAFERYYASGRGENYYTAVRKEIAKVFTQFPPYYPLINKYSKSFFVRVDFPSSEKYFVLGLLQEKGIVKYICYGLPAENNDVNDKDFVFVENKPTAFWMLFQDATTGQITTLPESV